MSKLAEYWKLLIERECGPALSLFGQEDVLRAAMAEWEGHLASGGGGSGVLRVHSSSDTYDRAPCETVVLMATVTAMHLTRMA